jgi:hypothetical protein
LKSKVGTELCDGNGHIWVGNGVPGVTDILKGEMWKGDYGGELITKGDGDK